MTTLLLKQTSEKREQFGQRGTLQRDEDINPPKRHKALNVIYCFLGYNNYIEGRFPKNKRSVRLREISSSFIPERNLLSLLSFITYISWQEKPLIYTPIYKPRLVIFLSHDVVMRITFCLTYYSLGALKRRLKTEGFTAVSREFIRNVLAVTLF